MNTCSGILQNFFLEGLSYMHFHVCGWRSRCVLKWLEAIPVMRQWQVCPNVCKCCVCLLAWHGSYCRTHWCWSEMFTMTVLGQVCKWLSWKIIWFSLQVISRVPDQNGVSRVWYIAEIHHSGRKPSIWLSQQIMCWDRLLNSIFLNLSLCTIFLIDQGCENV